jgi:hypothetical protein
MQHQLIPDDAKKRGGLTVSQAIEGFVLHKTAQGLSERTIGSYRDILEHWAARIGGETQVADITCPGYLIHPPLFLGQGGAVPR